VRRSGITGIDAECIQERGQWFFFGARGVPSSASPELPAVLDAGELADVSLPTLRSPMCKDVEAWVDECVEKFHQSWAERVREEVAALYESKEQDLPLRAKKYLVQVLERLSSMTT
jgi:hypothetical protein